MINQSADNAQTPVGIAFLEEERIGREVPVKFDLARMMGILLTAFEALQTFPKRAVADAFGVLINRRIIIVSLSFQKGVLFQKEHPLPDIMQQRFSVADRFHNVVRSANILQHFQ